MPPSCYQLPLEAKIQMIAGSKINCFYSKMFPTQHMSGWVAEQDYEIGASWGYMVRYKPN